MKVKKIGFIRSITSEKWATDFIETNKINNYQEFTGTLRENGFRSKSIGTNYEDTSSHRKFETASSWIHDSGVELYVIKGENALILEIGTLMIYCQFDNDGEKFDSTSPEKEKYKILDINIIQKNIQELKSQQEIKININIETDLHIIQSDFHEFKQEVEKLDEDLKKELEDLESDVLEIVPNSEQGKINKTMNKLSIFMQKVNDENSKFNKIIKGSKRGIELIQKVSKTYNKFAEWLLLPRIPELFLGN